jgi:pyruvate/2-oxoglutarate dehydrogenase complex dihydrolipoamide acyltransferase (E2) component
MPKDEIPLLMPDLGIDELPMTVSLWFARRGQRVAEGEPLVEILCGPATVELTAPASGVLMEKRAATDDEIRVGQTLAVIAEKDGEQYDHTGPQ